MRPEASAGAPEAACGAEWDGTEDMEGFQMTKAVSVPPGALPTKEMRDTTVFTPWQQ